MSKGSPVIRFRLPEVEHELLTTLAAPDAPGVAAKRIVLDWLQEHAGEPLKKAKQGKHNHVTRDIKPFGECPGCDEYHKKQAEKKEEPVENKLGKASRLKREWEEMQRDFPALAREIGSFDEYVRRNG